MKDAVNVGSVRRGSIWVLVMVTALGWVAPAAATDFEYWPKAFFRIPLDSEKQWQLSLEQWLTFNDDVSRFKDSETDFWVYYFGLAKWLGLGAGYKQVFSKTSDGWLTEDRPEFDVAFKTKVYGFGVVDRSRFELRFQEGQDFVTRYRNRLNLLSPVTFTALKINPYVAEESFINFDEQGYNQQRFYVGAFIPLDEKVRLELFYTRKFDKAHDEWQPTNVLGTWVYFQF